METAEQELDVPLSCLIKSTVIALWRKGSIGFMLRQMQTMTRKTIQDNINTWDSLGRVNGAEG